MDAIKLRTLSLTGVVAALLLSSASAWAHGERDYGREHHQGYRPAAVVVQPAVADYYYEPPPAYYVPPPVYVPAYDEQPVAYAPVGALGGALAGAAVGSALGHGGDRASAIAIGSIIGAMLGNQLTDGR